MRFPSDTFLGPYELQSLLGSGGMGEVYLAEDHRLHRQVAVKVLAERTRLDPEAERRFLQEVQAAAALNHPNILALYDVGEAEGVPYAVTELLKGETLRTRLERGPMPFEEALRFATAVAQGLAAAHAKGVIHRDLKPENLFLTEQGVAKILDFGLARLSIPCGSEDPTRTGAWNLTASGVVMGTACYMSPEQARGEEVDARTDLFSFGCVFYEMLSGQRAFGRPSAAESLSAILHEEPPALKLEVKAPQAELESRILSRCLAKDRRLRIDSADELVESLRLLPVAQRGRAGTWVPPSIGGSRGNTIGILSLILALALGGWFLMRPRSVTGAKIIAILPLQNLTGDPSLTFRSDGFSEILATNLMKVKDLSVISNTSTHKFSASNRPPLPSIAKALGADGVMEGSLVRSGNQFVIALSLHDRNDRSLWAGTFNGSLDDLDVMEGRARESLLKAMALGSQVPFRRGTTQPKAFEAYLKGLALTVKTPMMGFSKEAEECFGEAVHLDPEFLEARALWADALARRGYMSQHALGLSRQAIEVADAVLVRDPENAEAMLAKARGMWVNEGEFPHLEVVNLCSRALALKPSLVIAYCLRGNVFWHLGFTGSSIRQFEHATKLDPGTIQRDFAVFPMDAEGRTREGLEKYPGNLARQAWEGLPYLMANAGREQEALELALKHERTPQPEAGGFQTDSFRHSVLALLHARMGHAREARRYAERSIEEGEGSSVFHHAMFNLGCAYARLGDAVSAMKWLRRAAREGYPCLVAFERSQDLISLQASTEFQAFLNELREKRALWLKQLNDIQGLEIMDP